jgi:hypothetical protein
MFGEQMLMTVLKVIQNSGAYMWGARSNPAGVLIGSFRKILHGGILLTASPELAWSRF